VRHRADLVVPEETLHEIAVLKGVAAHYVMRAAERVADMERQRALVSELFEALLASGGAALDATHRADFDASPDDRARTRVVVDQVASLTDASAVSWHARLTGRAR
jgi:dGTPase